MERQDLSGNDSDDSTSEVVRGNGYFVYEDAPGAYYDGDYFVNSSTGEKIKDGNGTYYNEFETYEGTFVNGKRDGFGHQQFSTGNSYEGSFSNGKYHGKGTYIWKKEGRKYEGEWCHGLMHGQGTFTDEYDLQWTGQFIRGKYSSPLHHDFAELKRKEIVMSRGQTHSKDTTIRTALQSN